MWHTSYIALRAHVTASGNGHIVLRFILAWLFMWRDARGSASVVSSAIANEND